MPNEICDRIKYFASDDDFLLISNNFHFGNLCKHFANILHIWQFSVSCRLQYAVNHNLTAAAHCISQIKSWTNCANLTNCRIIAITRTSHKTKNVTPLPFWSPLHNKFAHVPYCALCVLLSLLLLSFSILG